MDQRLYKILEYNMSEDEARALKLALIWEEESGKCKNCGKIPKSGDPRKSSLFRYCFKLLNEVSLFDEQYRLYIKAQIDILKSFNAPISPMCLVGEKAWKRWLVWSRKYHIASKVNHDKNIEIPISKIKTKLLKTKEFLLKTYKKEPKPEDISKIIENNTIKRWISLGRICGYYLTLSPFINKFDIEKLLDIDLSLYKDHITCEIEDYFKKEFYWEF